MKTSFAAPIREELVEARKEAGEKWEAFESRRDHHKNVGTDLSTDQDALSELTELSGAYSEAKDKALGLEEKLFQVLAIDSVDAGVKSARDVGAAFDEITAGKGREIWTPGGRLTESDVYKSLKESGVLEKSKSRVEMNPIEVASRDEFKALLTGLSSTSGGAFVENDRLATYFPGPTRPDVISTLVTVGTTDSDIVEWVEETGFTNAAAMIAEATTVANGLKPESALAYAIVQSAVRTIAHWIPATKRALADAGQLRTLVDQRLRDGVRLALESQMVTGDGTGENFLGIVNTPGIATIAVGIAPDTALHAALRAITAIRLAFMEPTAFVMHPNDWMDIRLMRDSSGGANTGQFLYGPPSQTGPMFLWGVPVYTTPVVPEGNPIVGKMDEAMLWVREGVTVSATDSHADFFVRNLVAILAEGRFAFGIPRPEAFAEVTGA